MNVHHPSTSNLCHQLLCINEVLSNFKCPRFSAANLCRLQFQFRFKILTCLCIWHIAYVHIMSTVRCLFSCPEIYAQPLSTVQSGSLLALPPAVSLCRGCCRWPRACSRSRTWCTRARAAASSAPPWTASPAPPSAAQSARRSSPGATSSSTTCATTTPSS